MVARFAEVLKAKIVVVAGGLVPQSITGSSELPIVWRATKNKAVVRRLSVQVFTVVGMGLAAVVVDRVFQFSELLLRK
jgi:hypothetical protein